MQVHITDETVKERLQCKATSKQRSHIITFEGRKAAFSALWQEASLSKKKKYITPLHSIRLPFICIFFFVPQDKLTSSFFFKEPGECRGSGRGTPVAHLVLQDDAVVCAAGRRLPRDADAGPVARLQRRHLDGSGRGAGDCEKRRQIKMAQEPKVLQAIKVGMCKNKDPETWKQEVAGTLQKF